MTCSCPPTGWPDPDCSTHGLRPGQTFPPMDRHKLPGEDARGAQRRLYLESLGQMECVLCGRVGARGYSEHRDGNVTSIDRTDKRWRCASGLACGRRSRRRESDGRHRLKEVSDAIFLHRFVYGNEDDLQAAIELALRPRWAVVREHRLAGLGRDRIDLYLPAMRVGIETKIAGSPMAVVAQCQRYLAHHDLDALLLVTSRVRHQLPAFAFDKPVAVVQLSSRAL